MKDSITTILIILMLTSNAEVFIDLSLNIPLSHTVQEPF